MSKSHRTFVAAWPLALSSTSLLLTDLPASIIKKLPRYPTVPAVRMGRLAVDPSFKGKGLGGALLADALSLAARAEIAAHALVVDAKDEVAKAFYLHHGLLALPESSRTLFLTLTTGTAGLNFDFGLWE